MEGVYGRRLWKAFMEAFIEGGVVISQRDICRFHSF